MKFLDFLKKLGAVVVWPITHAAMLSQYFVTAEKDYPATRTAVVGLVDLIGKMTPDALAALAAKGFDLPDDVKTAVDLKGIFGYVMNTLLPVIHQDYTDFKLATVDGLTVAPPTPPVVTGTAIAQPASLHPASELVPGVPA